MAAVSLHIEPAIKVDPVLLVSNLNGEISESCPEWVSAVNAVTCLWSLSINAANHQPVLDAGAVPPAVANLQKGTPELKQACIRLLLALLASDAIEPIELRESMLESGICKALASVAAAHGTNGAPGRPATGHQLLETSLDAFSALLRPADAAGDDDLAEATAALRPVFKRVKPAALEAACCALAAAQQGKEGRGIRRAAVSLFAHLAAFPAAHQEILEAVSLDHVISQALTGTCPKERRALVLLLHNLAQADADTAAQLRRHLPPTQLPALVHALAGLLHCPDVWAAKAAALVALVLRGSLERRGAGGGGGGGGGGPASAVADVRPLLPALAALLRRQAVACLQHATAALWLMTADTDTAGVLVAAGALPYLIGLLSHKVYVIVFQANGILRRISTEPGVLEAILSCRPPVPAEFANSWKTPVAEHVVLPLPDHMVPGQLPVLDAVVASAQAEPTEKS
eukprot:jgi/Ulvmu1/310/UM001_0314.1